MSEAPTIEHLRVIAQQHGIEALGVARAEVFTSTLAELERRKDAGLHATMQFTYRNPKRSTDPSRALPHARSLIVGARSYLRDATDVDAPQGPAGAVARYVWEDHYAELRHGLRAVAAALELRGFATRLLIDDNALVDREAAYRAGLGWYGKNANILLPNHGSWFVLGSVVTNAEFAPVIPLDDGCGTCSRCLTSCPTNAIVEAGVVDANRCLAWLVQAEGQFPFEYRMALGDRIYGCDDCQEVCPPNRREARQPVVIRTSGADAHVLRPEVPLLRILGLGDDELLADYGRWYIPRRDPRYLRRNALIALGNVADPADPHVRAAVERFAASSDAMVRSHALWAARRLGYDTIVEAAADDRSPLVRHELDLEVPAR